MHEIDVYVEHAPWGDWVVSTFDEEMNHQGVEEEFLTLGEAMERALYLQKQFQSEGYISLLFVDGTEQTTQNPNRR